MDKPLPTTPPAVAQRWRGLRVSGAVGGLVLGVLVLNLLVGLLTIRHLQHGQR
jgi:hypothetical protein